VPCRRFVGELEGDITNAFSCTALYYIAFYCQVEATEPPPAPVDPRRPNDVSTVQVYQRATSAGLRGRIAQPIIQRTYCGATSEVPLKTDIYSLVAEYGIQKQRTLYPANEDHGSQIAAVAGLWQRYHG
jgi:hypothetical protein